MMAKYEPNLLSDELTFIDPVDYEQQNPKPWNILNEILDAYNNFDYIFTNPEKVIVNNRNVNWQVALQSKSNPDLKVTFANLSSGEKILLALAISMYKANSDKFFPDMLLLDEIDASLHPSMIKNLFKVVEEIFLKHSVKVILVTHSPTTIALADEESVFLMNKYGDNRLEKASKNNALSVLTEGFVSLTEDSSAVGISYGVESSKQNTILLTEGITDKIILETAWKILYPEISQPFYIQDCFDAGFLGNLLARGHEPSGIFQVYSNKQFIALFDFDNKGYSQWNNSKKDYSDIWLDPMNCLGKKHKTYNCHKLLLPVPEIENIKKQVINPDGSSNFQDQSYLTIEMLFYDVDILNTYFTEQPTPFGGRKIEFCGNKVFFANNIKGLSHDDFKHFTPLFERIKTIVANNQSK